jgi:hypothetical protein
MGIIKNPPAFSNTNRAFRKFHPSQYYFNSIMHYHGVSSKVNPTYLVTPFEKPSTNVVPYE